jgi:hypothetical protein
MARNAHVREACIDGGFDYLLDAAFPIAIPAMGMKTSGYQMDLPVRRSQYTVRYTGTRMKLLD